jgi:hypothetical protein
MLWSEPTVDTGRAALEVLRAMLLTLGCVLGPREPTLERERDPRALGVKSTLMGRGGVPVRGGRRGPLGGGPGRGPGGVPGRRGPVVGGRMSSAVRAMAGVSARMSLSLSLSILAVVAIP